MKKDLGARPFCFPMPVLMIATYGADGVVDVMNMAWGGVCANDMVALNIDEDHATTANIKARGAFTLSIADVAHLKESDYFGIASANDVPDKFARSGLHAMRSARVDAPVVEEYPVTLECEVAEIGPAVSGYRVVGRIVNVLVDERLVDAAGKVDVPAIGAFCFDQFNNDYYAIGEQVGTAWVSGREVLE